MAANWSVVTNHGDGGRFAIAAFPAPTARWPRDQNHTPATANSIWYANRRRSAEVIQQRPACDGATTGGKFCAMPQRPKSARDVAQLRHRVDRERPTRCEHAAVAEAEERGEQQDPAFVRKCGEAELTASAIGSPASATTIFRGTLSERLPSQMLETMAPSSAQPATRPVPADGLPTLENVVKKKSTNVMRSDRPNTIHQRLMKTTMKSCQSRTWACSG